MTPTDLPLKPRVIDDYVVTLDCAKDDAGKQYLVIRGEEKGKPSFEMAFHEHAVDDVWHAYRNLDRTSLARLMSCYVLIPVSTHAHRLFSEHPIGTILDDTTGPTLAQKIRESAAPAINNYPRRYV